MSLYEFGLVWLEKVGTVLRAQTTDGDHLLRLPGNMSGGPSKVEGKQQDGNLASEFIVGTLTKLRPKVLFSATYALIYSFLTKQAHTKAAEAVKKAAKDIVVLTDGTSKEDTSLDEIVSKWKTLSTSS